MTEPQGPDTPEEVAAAEAAATAEGMPVDPELDEPTSGDDPAGPSAEEQLAERTADLQRLQAEYVNYKRRVDRDRDLVRQGGEAAVLQALLTVLDDIGRAAQHGELEGGFKSVADSLQSTVTRFGLESFGEKGEPFDPQLHEAVFHAGESADVEVTTVDTVMQAGYRVKDRVLRPATVGVVDPAAEAPAESAAEADET